MPEVEVLLDGVSKRFEARKGEPAPATLDNISLSVSRGELLVVVGPSGCGKSTTLRLVAGLEHPDGGAITIAGRSMEGVAPQDRDVAMVFQGYALYPQMTARQILEFPLKMRRVDPAARRRAVDEAASLLRIEKLLDRRPGEMSGGERQRVAMGRAIVRKPRVFLFDEPLSNLDASLRGDIRLEIGQLVRRLGATALYVTHDHVEAMTLADRIAVMRAGKIEQTGTPAELYNRAINGFVAGFVAPTNLLSGKVVGGDNGVVQVETAGGLVRGVRGAASLPQNVVVSIRPDRLRVIGNNSASGVGLLGNRLSGPVIESRFLGSAGEYVIDVGGVRLAAVVSPPLAEVPPELSFGFEPADAWVVAE